MAKVKSTAAEGSSSTHIWRQQEVCHGQVCGHVAQETWLLTLNPCTCIIPGVPRGLTFSPLQHCIQFLKHFLTGNYGLPFFLIILVTLC